MSGTSEVVTVRGVTVRYGRTLALTDVSLTVPRGSVYALLGRNGSGKSSLIKVLLGQRSPDAGRVRVFGEDAWTRRESLMTRVGVVPEDPDAPRSLSAEQLSALCARLHGKWDGAGVADRLARFGVPPRTAFDRLSKGQKGAVMLCLALGHAPDLLVLDDPTLGLDVVARNAIFGEVIAELADRGVTVLLTTHDLSGIEGLADRVAILAKGRVVVEAELEDLKGRWQRSLEDVFAALVAGDPAPAERGAA